MKRSKRIIALVSLAALICGSIPAFGMTAKAAKEEVLKPKVSYTLDLSKGQTKIKDEDELREFVLALEQAAAGDEIVKIEVPIHQKDKMEYLYDLDKNGREDIRVLGNKTVSRGVTKLTGTVEVNRKRSIAGPYIITIPPASPKPGIGSSLTLPSSFTAIAIIFPDNHSWGSTTINMTSKKATVSDEDVAPVFWTVSYVATMRSIPYMNPETGIAYLNLDNDAKGTYDISMMITGKIEFEVLDTTSIYGDFKVELTAEEKTALENDKFFYYDTITFKLPAKPADPVKIDNAPKVEDAPPAHKVGDEVVDGTSSYTITSMDSGKETVVFTKSENAKATNVEIPDEITIDGTKFAVTEIKAGAFSKNAKIKKITIGKNVVKIGSKAFFKCKNLKSIRIKSTFLTKKTVGANAFKGIHPKAKAKVPKKLVNSYKKILKAKGLKGKDQKVTK